MENRPPKGHRETLLKEEQRQKSRLDRVESLGPRLQRESSRLGTGPSGAERLRFAAAREVPSQTDETNPQLLDCRLCRSVRPSSRAPCWVHFHRGRRKSSERALYQTL